MIAGERAQLEEETARLQRELEEAVSARARVVPEVTAAVLWTYETVRAKRGAAVAEVKGGYCSACHVRLRPQVANELLRQELLFQCESCQRFLYRAAGGAGTGGGRLVIVAYIDGGSRGNPGPAGYGVRIEDEQATLVEELRGALGVATNNVAEYHGLLAALAWAAERGVASLEIRSDSELLVKQMLGVYRVRNPGLQPLHQKARLLAARVGRVRFQHVRRELNKEADRLANEAMDEGQKTEDRR